MNRPARHATEECAAKPIASPNVWRGYYIPEILTILLAKIPPTQMHLVPP